MDDLRTRAELLRMKAELLIGLGTEVRDMAADLARQAATATTDTAASGPGSTATTSHTPPDVTDLMPDARRAYQELKAAGRRLHQTAITYRLREYGHKVSGARGLAVWNVLAEENPRQPLAPARPTPAPAPLPVLPDEPAPHAHLNGHSA